MSLTATHASASLEQLEQLSRARGVGAGQGAGRALGHMFSVARRFSSDLFGSAEKSYRATILGMQHGRGVFLLLEDAAVEAGDQVLADFCAQWLIARSPLVGQAEQELAWFAAHPEIACTRAALLGKTRSMTLATSA